MVEKEEVTAKDLEVGEVYMLEYTTSARHSLHGTNWIFKVVSSRPHTEVPDAVISECVVISDSDQSYTKHAPGYEVEFVSYEADPSWKLYKL